MANQKVFALTEEEYKDFVEMRRRHNGTRKKRGRGAEPPTDLTRTDVFFARVSEEITPFDAGTGTANGTPGEGLCTFYRAVLDDTDAGVEPTPELMEYDELPFKVYNSSIETYPVDRYVFVFKDAFGIWWVRPADGREVFLGILQTDISRGTSGDVALCEVLEDGVHLDGTIVTAVNRICDLVAVQYVYVVRWPSGLWDIISGDPCADYGTGTGSL